MEYWFGLCAENTSLILKPNNKFLKTKIPIKIATLNTRTLKDEWRLKELIFNMQKQRISIIGLQEHRRVQKEDLKYLQLEDHLLVTASAWRNSAQAATGGVGILLNKRAESVLRLC